MTTAIDPRLRLALEGSLTALQRLAESELPPSVGRRMEDMGSRKAFLSEAEQQEYLELVDYWRIRTLEKLDAQVALKRLREAVPDLAELL